jgi:predicted XRE-type DNA-binding protein
MCPAIGLLARRKSKARYQEQNPLYCADLMMRVGKPGNDRRLTQLAAATLMDISQAPPNQLLKGEITEFSLDVLVYLLAYAGRGVDLKLRRAALAISA